MKLFDLHHGFGYESLKFLVDIIRKKRHKNETDGKRCGNSMTAIAVRNTAIEFSGTDISFFIVYFLIQLPSFSSPSLSLHEPSSEGTLMLNFEVERQNKVPAIIS